MYTINLDTLQILCNGEAVYTAPQDRFGREGLRLAIERLPLDFKSKRALIHQVPHSDDEARYLREMGERLSSEM